MAKESKFADWLIATGRAMGYATHTSLAKAIGVPQPTVSRWKTGAKPSVEHLVKISELFGIELKTLLILSGHMKGEVSSEELALPISEAERLVDESPLEEALKEALRDFWKERMQEEHARLQELLKGVEYAVSPSGGIRGTELEPWLEKAVESGLARHLQRLQHSLVKAPRSHTWFVFSRSEGDEDTNPRDLFLRTVSKGGTVGAEVLRESARSGYWPLITCPEGGWDATTETLETAEDAEEAIRAFFQSHPSLVHGEAEHPDAPEEEDPS